MLRLFFGRVLGDHFPIDAKKLHLGIHGKCHSDTKSRFNKSGTFCEKWNKFLKILSICLWFFVADNDEPL